MNIWSTAVITTQGLNLLAKLVAGETMTITKAQTGAGTVAVSSLASQTAITTPKQTLSFRAPSYPSEGQVAVPCYLGNDTLSTGYTAKQVGIFAEDPDDGEILFFIAQADSGTGTAIPSGTEMPGFTAEWTFYFALGQADSVDVTVDPANTVSQGEAQTMINTAVEAAKAELNTTINGITTESLGALPTSGGTMTGDISFKGTKSTSQMIRFLDNTADAYGNGILVGDGGIVMLCSGESAAVVEPEYIPGNEKTVLAADTTIEFWTNCQNDPTKVTLSNAGILSGHQKAITYGTAAPSGGSSGDIYIQY